MLDFLGSRSSDLKFEPQLDSGTPSGEVHSIHAAASRNRISDISISTTYIGVSETHNE